EIPLRGVTLIVRSAGDPAVLAPAVRRRLAAIAPDVALSELRTLDQVVGRSYWRQRFFAVIFATFSILALLLAAVGLYGVLSHAVSRRRRELGLRAALGAGPGRLRGSVLGEALRLSAAGLVLGTAASLAATRLLASQLYAVTPTDPATFIAMA